MDKTKEQLDADTLFAFQMAIKGHRQFEFFARGRWRRADEVDSNFPHRIFHDIPEGWTRHDGEDWKGDKDAEFEGVMYCSGKIAIQENKAYILMGLGINNFTTPERQFRIYAYKLAEKKPEKKVIPWTFAEAPNNAKVKRKRDGKIFRTSAYPDMLGLYPTSFVSDGDRISYETLAADYLQLDGSPCGTEAEQ